MNKVVIEDLGQMEYAQLVKSFSSHNIEWEEEQIKSVGKLGDMETVNLILTISPMLIFVLGTWLLKNRDKTRFRKTIKIKDKDGSQREEIIEFDESVSKSPEANVIDALSKLFGIEKSVVAKELKISTPEDEKLS